ncbi:MAG: aminotransferase [Hyphomicrobiales bacterium]
MPAPAFNASVSSLSPPPIPAVQGWAKSYSGEHGATIDLSQAVPGYPPHPDMLRWLGEAAGARGYAGYGPIEGEAALREAYAAHVSSLYGAAVSRSNIHITAGCNQAFVCAALAIAGAGDAIALTNPCYFNHEATLAMLGIGMPSVKCEPRESFLPGLARIAEALKPGVRGLALVTPNNPTGAVYPPDLLRETYELCRRNGSWLILDETYRDFLPLAGEAPHGLFALPGWQDTLIQLYSFSKAFCIPGHRVGAIVAGEAVVGQVAKIMDNLQICAPRAAQSAVARALPALGDWRNANRLEIEARADTLREVMSAVPKWKVEAMGAYFAYVRHPFPDASSAQVAEALAKRAGILCLPGEYFGKGQEPFLRFAFANADTATIRRLAPRIARLEL